MKTLSNFWRWLWDTTPIKDDIMPHDLSELVNVVRRENGRNLEATATDILTKMMATLSKQDLIQYLIHINKGITIVGRLKDKLHISRTEDYLAYNFLVSYILSAWENKE